MATKGVEAAETAGRLLAGESIEEPLRTRLRERLGEVFSAYAAKCEALGDPDLAERCTNRGVLDVSTLEGTSP